jgi:hypothetical protein
MRCEYLIPWVGACGKEAGESGRCEEHAKLRCAGCGAQATRGCDYAASYVCGCPLCDRCEHPHGEASPGW